MNSTLKLGDDGNKKRLTMPSVAVLVVSMISTGLLTGCNSTTLPVAASGNRIGFITAGTSLTVTNDVYLVPPATLRKILNASNH